MRNEFGTFGDGEVSCSACTALCCRKGNAIPLTKLEAAQLRDAGTELRLMDRSEWEGGKPGRHRDFYVTESDCGNLDPDTSLCTVYDNRPRACREFGLGEFLCEKMRAHGGFAVIELGMPTMRQQVPEPIS